MDVPTLTPMMMGTEARTVNTVEMPLQPLPTLATCPPLPVEVGDSHLEATMLTTIEEDVLELCTSTVMSTPMTSPATGLDSTTLPLKTSLAILPTPGTEMH